jgi:hypothetical protein
MNEIICPGCGENVSLEGLTVGDAIDCPNCASLTLRIKNRGGDHYLRQIFKASCPSCDRIIEVPENASAGDTIECCGKQFTFTYEFGTYALKSEPADD